MKRTLIVSMLGAAVVAGSPASAQMSNRMADQPGSTAVAPRTPGGISAGATPQNQPKMDRTVDQIDSKLLNQEKDRPRLPNQSPSPSQTLPGGIALRAGASPP